jgi:hypothetical protein
MFRRSSGIPAFRSTIALWTSIAQRSASTGPVDEVGTQRPQPRERPLLIDAGEPTVADDIRSQNSRELSGLAHLPRCEVLLCQSRLKECPYLSREGPLQTTPCGRPVFRAHHPFIEPTLKGSSGSI